MATNRYQLFINKILGNLIVCKIKRGNISVWALSYLLNPFPDLNIKYTLNMVLFVYLLCEAYHYVTIITPNKETFIPSNLQYPCEPF